MKKTFKLWTGIFSSPTKGFTELTTSSPVVIPLIVVLILTIAGTAMLFPVMSGDTYVEAMSRVQVNTLKERGTELTAEQVEIMEQQLQSSRVQTITRITSLGGGLIGFVVILFVQALILLILTRIVKEKPSFKLLFRLIVFLALVSVIQVIVKYGITLLSDYERMLSRVQYNADLQRVLNSPVSLAALFSPTKLNPTLYALIDYVTDIFNWIYHIYLFFGLRVAAGLNKNKALIVTLISAVLLLAVSLVMTLFL